MKKTLIPEIICQNDPFLLVSTLIKNSVETGREVSIKELVVIIKKVVEYICQINFDPYKTDEGLRKFIEYKCFYDLGINPKINLEIYLSQVYKDIKKYNAIY